MKKLLLSILWAILFVSPSIAQDKYIRYRDDPSYEYIKQYMPEYYYEGYVIEGNPKMDAVPGANNIRVRVRVLRNHTDDKTFSYLLLLCGDEWQTLFPNEIDPLISFLNRVLDLLEKKPNDHNYYMFNSISGILFKTEWTKTAYSTYISMSNPPYYSLNIFFPEGESFTFTNKKQILNFIYKLNAAKQYLPDKETDFINKRKQDDIEWELGEAKEILI